MYIASLQDRSWVAMAMLVMHAMFVAKYVHNIISLTLKVTW